MKRRYTVTRKLGGGASSTAVFSTQKAAFHFIADLLASGSTAEVTIKSEPVA